MTITPGRVDVPVCLCCGKKVSSDEIALTRKLVNRAATSFYCIDCLAEHFKVTTDSLRERIDYFRRTGCALFM